MAEEKKDDSIKWLVIGGLALFAYDKFFGQSKEEKESAKEESKIVDAPVAKNPLTQAYTGSGSGKLPKGYTYIRSAAKPALGQAAKNIKKAIGTFTDDESKIIAAIKTAVTKPEVNLITRMYSFYFKRDLLFDLKDNLNAKELAPIFSYINKLPVWVKGK